MTPQTIYKLAIGRPSRSPIFGNFWPISQNCEHIFRCQRPHANTRPAIRSTPAKAVETLIHEQCYVGRLTHKQPKRVCEFFLSKYFFSESDICTNTSHWKHSINFHCKWVWQNADTYFQRFGSRNWGTNWLSKRQNSLWLVALKRLIGRSHLEVVKNSTIHFISKLSVKLHRQLCKL